jgi:hypothetical protein
MKLQEAETDEGAGQLEQGFLGLAGAVGAQTVLVI